MIDRLPNDLAGLGGIGPFLSADGVSWLAASFDVGLGHGFTEFSMHQVAAVAIENVLVSDLCNEYTLQPIGGLFIFCRSICQQLCPQNSLL